MAEVDAKQGKPRPTKQQQMVVLADEMTLAIDPTIVSATAERMFMLMLTRAVEGGLLKTSQESMVAVAEMCVAAAKKIHGTK